VTEPGPKGDLPHRDWSKGGGIASTTLPTLSSTVR
jgi:hypothetical protein